MGSVCPEHTWLPSTYVLVWAVGAMGLRGAALSRTWPEIFDDDEVNSSKSSSSDSWAMILGDRKLLCMRAVPPLRSEIIFPKIPRAFIQIFILWKNSNCWNSGNKTCQ